MVTEIRQEKRVDKVEWFDCNKATKKIIMTQTPIAIRLKK